jgi:protease I
LFNDPHAKRILKAFLKADMPVLLIGDSVKLLIAIEQVVGVSLTSSSTVKGDLIAASANWVDQAVMLDKNLITGSGSAKLEELVSEFSVKISEYEKEAIAAA